jgi:hypothetical protein
MFDKQSLDYLEVLCCHRTQGKPAEAIERAVIAVSRSASDHVLVRAPMVLARSETSTSRASKSTHIMSIDVK